MQKLETPSFVTSFLKRLALHSLLPITGAAAKHHCRCAGIEFNSQMALARRQGLGTIAASLKEDACGLVVSATAAALNLRSLSWLLGSWRLPEFGILW